MATRRTTQARQKAAKAEPAKDAVTVRALMRFADLLEGVDREPGDEFTATEQRFKEISDKLPGYVELA